MERRVPFRALLILAASVAALAVIAFFVYGPGYKWKARVFLNDIRAATTVHEVRLWAMKRISETGGQHVELDAPPHFLSATSDGPPTYLTVQSPGDSVEPYVLAVWGGGFGHWGLKIGSPTFQPLDDPDSFHIEWEPGVYAWHEVQ